MDALGMRAGSGNTQLALYHNQGDGTFTSVWLHRAWQLELDRGDGRTPRSKSATWTATDGLKDDFVLASDFAAGLIYQGVGLAANHLHSPRGLLPTIIDRLRHHGHRRQRHR